MTFLRYLIEIPNDRSKYEEGVYTQKRGAVPGSRERLLVHLRGEGGTMVEQLRECIGSFACRFRGALISTALIIGVAVVGIMLFAE